MPAAWSQDFPKVSDTGATSLTLDVNTTGATSGNLLVSVIVVKNGGDTFYTPTGWTLIHTYSAGGGANWGTACYYRTASGTSADDCAFSWDDAGFAYAVGQEFSGVLASTAPEDTDEDETYVASTAASTTSGSATPTTANGIAIAFGAAQNESSWGEETWAFSGGFGNIATAGAATRSTAAIASLAYTSVSAKTSTISTSEGDSRCYGAIAVFKEASAGGVTATPGVESVEITGYAPTVTASDHQSVTPANETLEITGLAPTVTATDNKTATPGTEAVEVTGLAPTVTIGGSQSVTPGTESVTITGLAPTVSANVGATPGAEVIEITGYAPTVTTPLEVTPATEAVEITGLAPVVSITSAVNVTPATESVEVTGYAPTITAVLLPVAQKTYMVKPLRTGYKARPIRTESQVKPIKTSYKVAV